MRATVSLFLRDTAAPSTVVGPAITLTRSADITSETTVDGAGLLILSPLRGVVAFDVSEAGLTARSEKGISPISPPASILRRYSKQSDLSPFLNRSLSRSKAQASAQAKVEASPTVPSWNQILQVLQELDLLRRQVAA